MSKYWILLGIVIGSLLLLSNVLLFKSKPVDNCPKYLVVESVKTEYTGAWAGDLLIVTTTDGSIYHPGGRDYYVGQKVCVNKL